MCVKKYTFCLGSIELEPRATFRWFFSCCMQLHSSPEFPRFLTSPDNRADCCPCTDCQVERGATLSRRFSARRPHPAPALPPLLLPPGLVQILSSHPSNLPTHLPEPGSLADPGSCFLVTYEPAGLINLLHLARRARPATAFRAQQLT